MYRFFCMLGIILCVGCTAIPSKDKRWDVATTVSSTLPGHPELPSTISPDALEHKLNELLREPLTPATAVQIGLYRNPQVAVELAALGVARAEREQAFLLSNPILAISALRPSGGGRWKLDAGLSQSLLDLLTRRLRIQMAEASYAQARIKINLQLVKFSHTIQTVWLEAVSAQHRAALRREMWDAAQANADLAKRYRNAGNISELESLLYVTEATTARLAAKQADTEFTQARLTLLAQLGLSTADKIQLPTQLSALPEESFDSETMESLALKQRLDLQLAQEMVASAEQWQKLNRRQKVAHAEAGVTTERDPDGEKSHGATLDLEIPLFDRGHARRAKAAAELAQAQAELAAQEIAVCSEVSQSLGALNAARDQARSLRDELIPARERIVELTLREYNAMLTSPFDLLLARQQQTTVYLDYVDALAAYWKARLDLQAAVGTALPLPESTLPQAPTPTETPDHEHSHTHSDSEGDH